MADNDPVQFTRESARRIARVVGTFERRDAREFLEADDPELATQAHPIEFGQLGAALTGSGEVTMTCDGSGREIMVRDPNIPSGKRWPAGAKASALFHLASGKWRIVQVWACLEDGT